MPSPEGGNHADYPQDPFLPPLFAHGPITRLKFQQAPNDKVRCVTHERVHYNTKELLDFSNLCRQKFGEYMWKWILKV